jgi:hypothetical protein
VTAAVRVDRLSLHAAALSEAQARRLAELVGLALGRVSMPASGAPRDLSVTVPAGSAPDGRSIEQLAEAVVRAIEAALRADGAAT